MVLAAQILLFIFPWRIRRWILNRVFHFELHPTSKIGFSLVKAEKVRLGSGARIGHLNFISKLELLDLGEESIISNLNYIYGVRKNGGLFEQVAFRESALVLGEHSAITSRHLIDCTDRVTFGPFCTLAGYRSTVLTHSVNFRENSQDCGPISVGAYSFIGTNCVLLRDVEIPPRCLVAAGSVVTSKKFEPDSVIGGVPAKVLRDVPADWQHFSRTEGRVL